MFVSIGVIEEVTTKVEAKAWIKKYLVALSELYFLFFIKTIGIKAIRLISILVQAMNQELAEIAIIIEKASSRKKKEVVG